MNEFVKTIVKLYGNEGAAWLRKLPDLIQNKAQEWKLKSLHPLKDLTYNYVLAGLQDNNPIVLKIGYDIAALKREVAALQAFVGRGAVSVLAEDLEAGAVLLEQVIPGYNLIDFFPKHETQATLLAANFIKTLHHDLVSSNYPFPTVESWLTVLDKDWEIPRAYLIKARELRNKLLASSSRPILLHGDLHHGNILVDEKNQGRMIDPKGVIGELAYEAGAFIRNPIERLSNNLQAKHIIDLRCKLLERELNIPAKRLQEWCFVQAVLSVCWMLEDNLDPSDNLKLVEILFQMQ